MDCSEKYKIITDHPNKPVMAYCLNLENNTFEEIRIGYSFHFCNKVADKFKTYRFFSRCINETTDRIKVTVCADEIKRSYKYETKRNICKYGVIDHENNVILPCIYDEPFDARGDYFRLVINNPNKDGLPQKFCFYANEDGCPVCFYKGEKTLCVNVDAINDVTEDGLVIFLKGNKIGLYDIFNKELLLAPQYESIEYVNPILYCKINDSMFSFMVNRVQDTIVLREIRFEFKALYVLTHLNIIVVKDKNERFGFRDSKTFDEIMPCDYIRLEHEEGRQFIITNNISDKITINEDIVNGNDEIPLKVTKKNEKQGIITLGQEIIEILPCIYDKVVIQKYPDNLFDWMHGTDKKELWYVCKNDLWGVVSIQERCLIIPTIIPNDIFEHRTSNSQTLIKYGYIVCKEHRWGNTPTTYIYNINSKLKIHINENEEIKELTQDYFYTKCNHKTRKYDYYGNLIEEKSCDEYVGIKKYENPYALRSERQRDTWDAMTDGQYDDLPEGFDDDYSFLGQ